MHYAAGKPVPRTAEEIVDVVRYVGRESGYAIGVHGTLIRDIDLMAMAWSGNPVTPEVLARSIAQELGWECVSGTTVKPRGRICFVIRSPELVWHHRYIDLSIMDATAQATEQASLNLQLKEKVEQLEKQLTELRISATPSP